MVNHYADTVQEVSPAGPARSSHPVSEKHVHTAEKLSSSPDASHEAGSGGPRAKWLGFLGRTNNHNHSAGTGNVVEMQGESFWAKAYKFVRFMGPGAIISVAYVDPDNYQTAITSGASFQYKLLFMVLVSNIIAIYLQSLSVKLGTVTGLDLAQMNHKHLPRWLELFIYLIAEACIICTDLGQVIGTAIALNILNPGIPLPAGCAISVAETLLILLFYNPAGQLRRIRIFEIFIACLIIIMFITICIALSMVSEPAGLVFRGFVPSREIFVDQGLYNSCAILGGTLQPHTLYLGSALSRTRLFDFDSKHSLEGETARLSPNASTESMYRPSLRAIKSCLKYSIAELAFTLFTIAIFVNSALLIISGSAFYKDPSSPSYGGDNQDDDDDDDGTTGTGSSAGSGDSSATDVSGDLYDLYGLFGSEIAPAAGTLFAVSLLFAGITAGIVATMAGQTVMEGALHIRINPFLRRLLTRLVAIIPAMIIGASLGKDGLSRALVACNYVLAIGLIFVSFPLVYYTCRHRYMQVPTDDGTGTVSLRNSWPNIIIAWLIWFLVVFMDVATVVLLGLGVTSDDD